MRRFLIVYIMGTLGAVGGAALGSAVLRPIPTPGPTDCGMWALPGIVLGGAIGAGLAIFAGLRLTRRAAVPLPNEQREQGPA
jgi:hypothetical protein